MRFGELVVEAIDDYRKQEDCSLRANTAISPRPYKDIWRTRSVAMREAGNLSVGFLLLDGFPCRAQSRTTEKLTEPATLATDETLMVHAETCS
jgi:hypothetical protein